MQYIFVFQIATASMIQECDKVEKCFSKILVTCNYLQTQIVDPKLRQELIILSNFIKDLFPKFTAAGFFQLNKGLFSSLLSALVSYLIILIQFKAGKVT